MIKKSLAFLLLLLAIPAFADYNPMSDAPIESVDKFYSEEDELSSPEFEYTAGEAEILEQEEKQGLLIAATEYKLLQFTGTYLRDKLSRFHH